MVLRRQLTTFGSIFWMAAVASVAPLTPAGQSIARAEAQADCNAIHSGPCTKKAGERLVTLEIDPKPVRHFAELTFRITIAPCDGMPSNIKLDLGMPGMIMGKNQVDMTRKGACTWEGRGIIVKCRSGRTLWRATLLAPELGNPAFTFNVRN